MLSVASQGGLGDPATALLAAGRVDGSVDCVDPATGALRWGITPNTPQDAVQGLHVRFPGSNAAATVVSVSASGAARMHTAGEDGSATELASWTVPATVCCSALDPASDRLAVGSEGAELRVYDLAAPSQPPAYTAKGGKPNKVGLVDRPWNSALAFLPGSAGKKIVIGTGLHKFRLYDESVGKRPQIDIAFGEARITAVAPEADGSRCWVANGIGQLEVYDFRAGKFDGGIKGIAGSLRALALHPDSSSGTAGGTGSTIASAGLDRFLRVHDTTSRRSVGKVYLKTQLTGVAFCPTDASMAPPAPAAAAAAAAEDGRPAQRGDAGQRRGGKRRDEDGAEGGRRPKNVRR